ncbi:hypothetical protein [Pseudomonas piscis]|uniref:hypothetical protein n=1 Tax=Pseudomonas piscis TaxID=2614538 RepID=UPI0021D61499|nr:hypothetical protein [Pseudomonas piscis]MCU7650511.1 hypothetical protein [Pseudomonas piscis]
MKLSWPRFTLPAALLLSVSLSGCVSDLGSGAYVTQDDQRYAQLLDQVDAALKANMAVVLVADVMPHKSLSDALTMTQWTPTAIWEYEKDPKVTFGRKFQTNELQRKPGETYLFKAFEVHILPPGKYLLTGGDDYQIHGLLDQIGARSGPPGSGRGANGTAYLSAELYREYYREEVWKDATYGSEIKTEKVCTTVHVASGACVAWGEQQYTQTTQGSGAGYYQQTDSRDVPSIKVQARLPVDKALASFTLQGGQLLLAPRMHLKTPGYKYQQSKCRAIDPRKIECPLDNLTVYTWPAPMSFTQNLIEQRVLSDKHRQLLSRLQPMQITPLGKQGMEDPIWGVPLSLSK